MTSIATLQEFNQAAKEAVSNSIQGDSWRMTSFLIQLLNKLESYYTSLNEQNPDDDFYSAQVATTSALELISSTYDVPVDNEKFEEVKELYAATIDLFIQDYSDDAIADVIHISNLANYVAGMRTYCWNNYITETGPSESKFEALKLAKRDEKAVELAVKAASDVIFA